MPVGQALPRRAQPIGAGRWQPVDIADVRHRQPHAFADEGVAVAIVRTLPARAIEQPAGDVGSDQRTGFVILELVDAAFAAAVAQRLPLSAIELRSEDRRVGKECVSTCSTWW